MLSLKKILLKILNRLNELKGVGETQYSGPSAVSCTTGYYRQLAYLTLGSGTWIISGSLYAPYTNTTGIRRIFFTTADSGYDNTTTAPANYAVAGYAQCPVSGNYNVYLHTATFHVTLSSSTTFRLIGFQNSGASANLTGRIYAVRIK